MATELLEGDCLEVLKNLDDSQFTLAYLDPPFFTQKTQRLRTRDRQKEFSFSDIWDSFSDYAQFLYYRLEQIHRVLSPTGTVFVHCDRTASHVVRALLDDIFGMEMFRAEIIWHYRRWSNSQKNLLPAHQNIYFYSKTNDYKFNTLYQEYSPATNVDQILQRRERDEWGKTIYARDGDGIVLSNGCKKGVPLSDVWDIPYLNPKAQERTGYPTQKPILLLERIIELATDKGDWILDPFCGSGTTLVAATLLGRNAVGIDVSADAIQVANDRLSRPIKSDSELLKKGRAAYQTVDSAAIALLEGLDIVPVHRNSGIDALLRDPVGDRPVPIRVQRPHETVSEAAAALYSAGRTKHAKVMILVTNQLIDDTKLAEIPTELILIKAPAQSIREEVEKIQEELISEASTEKCQVSL